MLRRKFMLFQKCKQFFLYGGLEQSQFRLISSAIDESNRKGITALSVSCTAFFALRLSLHYAAVPAMNRLVFFSAIVLFLILALLNAHIKNCPLLVHISAYLFLSFYLLVGILSAVSPGSVQQRTTLYLVFIVVAPMLFALNAVELSAIVLPAQAVYLFLIHRFQSGYPVYITNVGNSMFFSASGLLLGIYMANMKISGIYNTYMNARSEEIRQLNEQLSLSQAQLQKALAEAESASRAKSAFLSNMSHDIRTPMNAIIGFTALAKPHINETQRVVDALDKIEISSRHLLSLINDVLDMSRIESGKVKITKAPFSLVEVANDVSAILQSSLAAKNQHFTMDISSITQPILLGDALRLQQVLLNVLGNAVKFTPEEGQISFRIEQSAAAPAGFADFTFFLRDTGIGMSAEFQKHIFEAFSRAETTAVKGIQGTGLGMAISKKIVDLMGGTISVQSEESKGSEFIIHLRFAVCEALPEAVPAAPVNFSGKRILLAEDNALNEEIACAILTEAGFLVDCVSDGAQAVAKLQSVPAGHYDVVLMDIQMPNLNGYDATRRIRALPDRKKAAVPILAMTADAFEEDKQAALAAGMNGHIAKPIEVTKLMQALGQILSA